jgi:hypothetical protein
MTRFFGNIGYGNTVDKGDGVHEIEVTVRQYQGDVVRPTRRYSNDDKVNSDLSVGNAISIVADGYANNHFFAIRYAEWRGALWEVTRVDIESPRLILWLGGVYNGPTPPPPSDP